jgi:hypothetical protein
MPSSNSEEEDGHPNKVDNSDIYSDDHDKDDDDLEDESDNEESDNDTHDTINGKKCNIANKDKVTVVYGFQIKYFDVFTGEKGAEYVGAIEKGLNEYMTEQKVAFTKHPANLIHDSSISAATAAAYKKHVLGFYQFAALTADYQAMLLLGYYKVDNDDYDYASMKADTLKYYMLWKCESSKTKLRREHGPLRDVCRHQITGKGHAAVRKQG